MANPFYKLILGRISGTIHSKFQINDFSALDLRSRPIAINGHIQNTLPESRAYNLELIIIC